VNRDFVNSLLISASLLFASASTFAGPRDELVANVSVYAHTLNNKVAYTYTIENAGDRPILGFSIGFDHYTGASELSGDHPKEVVSPDSWQSRIITLEESPYYEVRWEPGPGAERLAPGSSKTGFTVVMDSANPQLLNGHWTTIIDGPPSYASSRLEVLEGPPEDVDTVPPGITVAVDPTAIWPPNNTMAAVVASVAATDDKDPNPEVSLVSVTCNECDPVVDVRGAELGTADFAFSVRASRTGLAKPGRVYTVVYSATDSSGNRSEGSATITVPHDQRRK